MRALNIYLYCLCHAHFIDSTNYQCNLTAAQIDKPFCTIISKR